MKKILTFILCGFVAISSWAQSPGDSCSIAIPLVVGTDCSSPSTLDFSSAVDIGLTACDGFGPNLGKWYSFTAPASGNVDLVINSTDGVESELLDACGGTSIDCNSFATTNTQSYIGLVPGQTYFLVIWRDVAPAGPVLFCLVQGPDCAPAPSGINFTNISSTAAAVNWTADTSATGFVIEYGIEGFTPGTGATITSGAIGGPVSISGLSAETVYDVYISTSCALGSSRTVGPTSFSTLCNPFTPPLSEDFSTFTPNCWEQAGDGRPSTGPTGLGSSLWLTDEWLNTPGTVNGDGVNINLFTGSKNEWIISPLIDLSGGGYELSIDVAVTNFNSATPDNMGANDTVQLLINEDNTGWQVLRTWTAVNQPVNTGETVVTDLSAFTSSSAQFAIWATEGGVDNIEDYDFHIDNFIIRVPPNCPEPTGLIASNLTTTSFDLSWTNASGVAVGYDLYYGVSPLAAPTGATTPTESGVLTNVDYTLSGLSPGDTVIVYVRTDCSDFISTWTAPLTVVLPLQGQLCSAPAAALGVVANCDSLNATMIDFANMNPIGDLSCDAFGSNYGQWYTFIAPSSGNIDIVNNGTNSFEVAIFDACGGNEIFCSNATTTATRIVAGLSPGAEYRMVVWRDAQSLSTSFCLVEGPACLPISGLSVGNITATTADVTWDGNSIASGFIVEYGPTGFALGSGSQITSGTSGGPITISGLNGLTSYDVYVIETCEGGQDTLGPQSFTTDCPAVFVPDYTEDFTSFLPQCWEEADGGTPVTGPSSFGSGAWTSDGLGNVGFSGAARINLFSTGKSDWLLSPAFDLQTGGYEVIFDVALTPFSTTGPASFEGDDRVEFLVSTDDGATWTSLAVWDSSTVISNTGDFVQFDLASYALPNVQFAFWGSEEVADDPVDVNFYVDNFTVRLIPSCFEVANVTIDSLNASKAFISWTDLNPSPTNNYVITYTTVDGASAQQVANTTSATLTGLQPTTSYEVSIVAVCGVSDTSQASPIVSFTTDCGVFMAPYMEAFDAFLPICWEESGNTAGGEWVGDDFGNEAANGRCAKLNLFDLERDTLFSPEIDMTASGNYVASWRIALTSWNNSNASTLGDDDVVQVWIKRSTDPTWTVLMTYDTSSMLQPAGQIDSMDISAYAGDIVQLAIFGSGGDVNDSNDNDVFVDDVSVTYETGDPCGPLNITGAIDAGTYQGTTVASDGQVPSPNTVIFKAQNDIDLVPNFEVEAGATFEAVIEDCP